MVEGSGVEFDVYELITVIYWFAVWASVQVIIILIVLDGHAHEFVIYDTVDEVV